MLKWEINKNLTKSLRDGLPGLWRSFSLTESQRPNGMGQTNEQHPKPSYGDRKCRTDFRIRIYDQGRQGVPTLCRLFLLYSQQLCKNIPSTAEAPKPDGEQENQYTAHNPEAANNNCTWKSNPSASAFARTMLRFIWRSRTIECGIVTPAA